MPFDIQPDFLRNPAVDIVEHGFNTYVSHLRSLVWGRRGWASCTARPPCRSRINERREGLENTEKFDHSFETAPTQKPFKLFQATCPCWSDTGHRHLHNFTNFLVARILDVKVQ